MLPWLALKFRAKMDGMLDAESQLEIQLLLSWTKGLSFLCFFNQKNVKNEKKKREFLVITEHNLEKVIYISLLSKYLAMIMFIESVILMDLKLDVIPMLSRQCLRVSSHGQMLFSVFQTRL